jgi:hypothetical protein
MNLLRISGDST